MSAQEKNKELIKDYVKAFDSGKMDKLAALFSPDAEIQGVLGKGQMETAMPIWKQLVEGLGMQLKIEDLIAEGDVVAARYTETGIFNAPFMGNEPTGRAYELVAMEWFVIKDGVIVRRWGARDGSSQAKQLGLALK